MRTISVNNFGGGIADDIYNAGSGEFSLTKHFDTLTYPTRLHPLRGMTAESVTNSKVENIIVNSTNGLMYGVGEDPSNPGTSGKLWQRAGYGGSDVWQSLSTNQLSGAVYNPAFLVDFRNAGQGRTLYWASANLLVASDPSGSSSASTQSLTFTSIGQGLVHPKDQVLYFPYQNATNASYIGLIASNASPFGGLNATAFALPLGYRAYGLSYFGNQLAVPLTSVGTTTPNGANNASSEVGLWSRDTSITTFDDTIPWGNGTLQVLNNLQGTLIGISTASANFNNSIQDQDSIIIKGWNGGAEPFLIKELIANHLSASSHPTCTINPNVNFIYRNRMYFSVNIVPNDGTSNNLYGLFSIGKAKNGRWNVVLERMATNTGTETGVIAAAITGDFVAMAHTAAGTLTASTNGQTSSSTYSATSVYESVVNPEMPYNPHRGVLDPLHKKKLMSIGVNFIPLTSGAQVVMKVRIDSTGAWTTILTKTTSSPDSNLVMGRMKINPSFGLVDGRNIEFRLESTGGAEITAFHYTYETLDLEL